MQLLFNSINTAYNETTKVEAESRLVQNLFNSYNTKLRPTDTVEIKFSLYLNQIITLMEQEQIIVLNVFLDHEWIDGMKYSYFYFFLIIRNKNYFPHKGRLKWDPKNYSNISLLRLSSDKIWT